MSGQRLVHEPSLGQVRQLCVVWHRRHPQCWFPAAMQQRYMHRRLSQAFLAQRNAPWQWPQVILAQRNTRWQRPQVVLAQQGIGMG